MTTPIPVEEKLNQLRTAVTGLGIDDLMKYYRSIEDNKRQVKQQLETLTAMSDIVETALNDFLLSSNQRGAVTNHGKVERKLKTQYYVSDKVTFRNWAIENGLEELMTISVAQKAIANFIDSQYQEYLQAFSEGKTSANTFDPVLPDGIAKKEEFKLSITKVK